MIRPEPAQVMGLTFYQTTVALFAIALITQWLWDSRSSVLSPWRREREPRC